MNAIDWRGSRDSPTATRRRVSAGRCFTDNAAVRSDEGELHRRVVNLHEAPIARDRPALLVWLGIEAVHVAEGNGVARIAGRRRTREGDLRRF